MATRTLQLKAKAWLNDEFGPDDLLRQQDNDQVVRALSIFPSCHNMASLGYSFIGDVEMTVQVGDEKELIENKVESLKAEKAKVLSEAQAKATQLESKIQKLLAITYEAA